MAIKGVAEGRYNLREYLAFSGASTFTDYLELCGGAGRLDYLKRREFLKEPMTAPWRK